MGSCCPREKKIAITPSTSRSASAPHRTEERIMQLPSKSVVKPTTAEEMRVRARRQAIQALTDSIRAGESTIPTIKWRRQYIKTPGIGPAVASVIAHHIQGISMVVPNPKVNNSIQPVTRPPHHIRTLDMRAIHIGDDGFLEMMSALLDDTLIENAIFSGNDITDDGISKLVSRMNMYEGALFVDNVAPNAVVASATARNMLKKDLPCKLKLLALTENTITSEGIATLTAAAHLFAHLEQLEVGRGQSGGGGDVDDVRDTLAANHIAAIVSYIQRPTKLQTFLYKGNGNYYARNGFTPDGLTTFLEATVGGSDLKELCLQDCFTTKPGMAGPVTVPAPRRGKAITFDELDDSWTLKDLQQPMHVLSMALTSASSHLNTLSLRFPLSDEAVEILCIGIAQAPNLLNLSLRGCDLSSKALSVIGDALSKNNALSLLDVSYQSHDIAHPAYLAELRSSSRKKVSLVAAAVYPEMPSYEKRQHALLPIIRSLHKNRTLSRLLMLGVDVATDDLEELCACMERSGNRTLAQVWYTRSGNDALDMKLEDLLLANREYSADRMATATSESLYHSSVRRHPRGMAMRTERLDNMFSPDSCILTDSSEPLAKSITETPKNEFHRNASMPDLPTNTLLLSHSSSQQNGNTLIKRNGEDVENLMVGGIPSLLKGTQRVPSMDAIAAASQISIAINSGDNYAPGMQPISTQNLNDEETSPFSSRSANDNDDADTVPYFSRTSRV